METLIQYGTWYLEIAAIVAALMFCGTMVAGAMGAMETPEPEELGALSTKGRVVAFTFASVGGLVLAAMLGLWKGITWPYQAVRAVRWVTR